MKTLQTILSLIYRLAVVLAFAIAAHAQDIVVTKDGRTEGRFSIKGNKAMLNDGALNWERVATVLTDRRTVITSPNALVMRSGERWRCTIVGLNNNKVRVRTAPYGSVDIDVQLVASLVFNETGDDGGKPGRLYRTHGNPISGRLTGVSASALSLDSALGVFNLDRKDVGRYVIATVEDREELDALHLVNGSLYHATLVPRGAALEIEHPILGKASIAHSAVCAIRRRSPGWTRASVWELLAADSPIGKPGTPEWLSSTDPTWLDVPPWITALRVEADTRLRCDAPSERPRRFTALVSPASRHPGMLLALAGDQVLSERSISADDTPRGWSFKIPAGQVLQLRFKFSDPPGVPCAVIIGDPILFWE